MMLIPHALIPDSLIPTNLLAAQQGFLTCPYCGGGVGATAPYHPHDSEAFLMHPEKCWHCGYVGLTEDFGPYGHLKHFDGLVAPLDPHPWRWVINPDAEPYCVVLVLAGAYATARLWIDQNRQDGRKYVHVSDYQKLLSIWNCEVVLLWGFEKLPMRAFEQLSVMAMRGAVIHYSEVQ